MKISSQKKQEVIRLFEVFINSYLYTAHGIARSEAYKKKSKIIFSNLEKIASDKTTQSLIKELSITYEPLLELYSNNTNFLYIILHLIKPNQFLCIDRSSLQVINYLANTKYSLEVKDYFELNSLGSQIVRQIFKEINQVSIPTLSNEDLFALFSYWLVEVKQYNFAQNEIHYCQQSLEKIVNNLKIKPHKIENWIKTLQRKKQIIFQGSPGTGKTFIAENIAQYLIGGTDGFYETIQFHPAYTYEDFIQGIRPQTNNGQLEYNLVSGRFLEFCCKAKTCKDNCILIIDEVNRANLSQVFGELMYLLEYRDKEIALAGSEDKFKIPGNVYIIGTMNTADRSIALVDFALRRRFAFIKVEPNYEIIRQFHQESNNIDVEGLISVLERIDRAISDRNYSLGISYFLTENLAENLENIWCLEIETYLEEYFYNSIEQVDEFRWENVKEEIINI